MSETAMVPAGVAVANYFSAEQTELIKRQIAKGCTDDELKLFLYQCARTGLDPFSRQIYALKRKEYSDGVWVEKLSIQTGIDGFRLIAERTGRYAPGPDNDYVYDDNGNLVKATAHVMKLAGGQWHKVSASAHLKEYAQTRRDGGFTKMWAEKPHIMLGKCAEALALRRAFPAEMSGLYTTDELPEQEQAPVYQPPAKVAQATAEVDRKIAALRAVPKDAPEPATPASATAVDVVKAVFPGAKEQDGREWRINALAISPPPEGLGWTKPHAKNWLMKVFGAASTRQLSEEQKADAEMLLQTRLNSEDAYNVALTTLIAEGHVRAEAGE